MSLRVSFKGFPAVPLKMFHLLLSFHSRQLRRSSGPVFIIIIIIIVIMKKKQKNIDGGVGSSALPLDKLEFGSLSTSPAVAVDNCTRAPVEPAVGSVSRPELANRVTRADSLLFPLTRSRMIPDDGEAISVHAASPVALTMTGLNTRSPIP